MLIYDAVVGGAVAIAFANNISASGADLILRGARKMMQQHLWLGFVPHIPHWSSI